MKGKNTFTVEEIEDLKQLIQLRVKADREDQKRIRNVMRRIGFYGSDFGIVDCQVSDLEGLIRSGVIKVIDGNSVPSAKLVDSPRSAVNSKAAKTVASEPKAVKGLVTAEKSLLQGQFISVGALSGVMVPDVPGMYCIKLRKEARLPAKFGKVREDGIIYIGQASTSLYQRLWRQELNHHGAATFFRSIGAMLGYLPPTGSLAGKSTRNYKFSPEDTEAIREWMRKNLEVNYIAVKPSVIDDIEETLIRRLCPLVNISKNPSASAELSAVRDKCVAYAKSE